MDQEQELSFLSPFQKHGTQTAGRNKCDHSLGLAAEGLVVEEESEPWSG